MASEATEKMLAEMIESAKKGREIIPMFWQPLRGRSNTVSAAIRLGVKRGKLVKSGVDGLGKPTYTAPFPKTTFEAPATVQ